MVGAMSPPRDWQSETARLGNADPAHPTGWFEQLWSRAEAGEITTPWDRDDPHWALADRFVPEPGDGATAVVSGCGLGADAEHLARAGYRTTAFDISPTAIAAARERRTGSPVTYEVGDLLDLPAPWRGGFDLVVEIFTVQAAHRSIREGLTAGVRSLLAPGGSLLAIQAVGDPADDDGPPWPLTRAEMTAFADGPGLGLAALDQVTHPTDPERPVLWRAVVRRDADVAGPDT